MNEDGKFFITIWSIFAIVAIIIGLFILKDCESDRDAISDCIKAGQKPLECRHAFHPSQVAE